MAESTFAAPDTMTDDPQQRFWRAFVRYPVDWNPSCEQVATNKFKCRWAEALDISQGGIGLILGRAMAAGTPMSILLKFEHQESLMELLAHVVNCRLLTDGNWLVGCEFDTCLPVEALQDLT